MRKVSEDWNYWVMALTPKQQAEFDEASNHPYECKCRICKKWWKLVGPERDNDGDLDDDEPAF